MISLSSVQLTEVVIVLTCACEVADSNVVLGHLSILTEILCGFLSAARQMLVYLKLVGDHFPSTSFPIHYFLSSTRLCYIYSESLTYLNKQ